MTPTTANARVVPRIKGLSFIHRHGFLLERFGEEGLQRILRGVSPETAQVLRTASAQDWVPLQRLVEVDLAIVETFFGKDLKAGRIIGEYNMNQAISRIYKLVMRLISAEMAVKRTAAVWEKIVQGGALTATMTGPRCGTLMLSGIDPLHRLYCHVLAGGFEGVLHACGEAQARCEHIECVMDGAAACRFEMRW
ncbi:MAG: hypothetical protein QM765_40280 [Myxococcales bacterium]